MKKLHDKKQKSPSNIIGAYCIIPSLYIIFSPTLALIGDRGSECALPIRNNIHNNDNNTVLQVLYTGKTWTASIRVCVYVYVTNTWHGKSEKYFNFLKCTHSCITLLLRISGVCVVFRTAESFKLVSVAYT